MESLGYLIKVAATLKHKLNQELLYNIRDQNESPELKDIKIIMVPKPRRTLEGHSIFFAYLTRTKIMPVKPRMQLVYFLKQAENLNCPKVNNPK